MKSRYNAGILCPSFVSDQITGIGCKSDDHLYKSEQKTDRFTLSRHRINAVDGPGVLGRLHERL